MELSDEQKRLADAELLRQSGYNGAVMNGAAPGPDQRPAVAIGGGRTAQAVNETLEILREHPDVYDLGGALVRVHDGHVLPLDRHSASHLLGCLIQFYKIKDNKMTADDPPQRLVDQLLSLGTARGLRPLDAVTTIPTIRPDGTILATPGYDPATRLLYVGEPVGVPMVPSAEELHAAYNDLLFPVRLFPFVAPVDWAVMLAALLTAVVRPALPTAPAFAFDAPDVGAGKTLLAKCIATLATGEAPEPWPHVARRDDEEIRKRLFTALRSGELVVFWDNCAGTIDSPSLAAFLTAARFQDRILGRSESLALPNRAIFLMSGNNIDLAGDMPRRVLTARIDPKMEQAFARQFDLDPLDHVARNRQRLAVAALTIIRAWLSSGAPRASGRTASFERWDDLVRQPVAWLMQVDPIDAIRTTAKADPKREAAATLLTALHDAFGADGFTAADVESIVRRCWQHGGPFATETERALASAVKAIAGNDKPNALTIGHILRHRRDRIISNMRLVSRLTRRNVQEWVVEIGGDEN